MKITYNISLTNPVRNFLKISDEAEEDGSFDIFYKKNCILIKGDFRANTEVKKAYDYSFLGASYGLHSKKSLELNTIEVVEEDMEKLFNLLDKTITDPSFTELQSYFKKAKKTVEGFYVEDYVENSSDIFLINITEGGSIKAVDGFVKPRTNAIQLNKDIDGIILYKLVSQPLKISTNDTLTIPVKDFLKIPTGFCTLTNEIYTLNVDELTQKEGYNVLSTSLESSCEVSTPVLVDGVSRKNFTMRDGEKVLIEIENNFTAFNKNMLEKNVVLIYKVEEDSSLTPHLAIDNLTGNSYSSSKALLRDYEEFLEADEEFLKKFLVQEYQIPLTTKFNKYFLYNTSVISTMLDTKEFVGRIIKP